MCVRELVRVCLDFLYYPSEPRHCLQKTSTTSLDTILVTEVRRYIIPTVSLLKEALEAVVRQSVWRPSHANYVDLEFLFGHHSEPILFLRDIRWKIKYLLPLMLLVPVQRMLSYVSWDYILARLILGMHPTNERRRYKVTPSLVGRTQMRDVVPSAWTTYISNVCWVVASPGRQTLQLVGLFYNSLKCHSYRSSPNLAFNQHKITTVHLG